MAQTTVKIIGAGFGRTGTLSLKGALEQLGFARCYHMFEVMQNPHHIDIWQAAGRGEAIDWPQLFDGYQSTVDWPSCNFWQQQMVAFPGARVLLSLRDPDKWYDSVMNTIWPTTQLGMQSEDERARKQVQMAMDLIWNGIFDGRMDDRSHVIGKFNEHNQHVIDTVPPERLLVWEASHGWEPLCTFLECPVPDTAFPRVNTTEDFKARVVPSRD